MELTTATKEFITHWGEMGTRWGINRTVAQIHALLFISETPLTADEISDTLSIARSTVSTGLHELQSWDLVRIVHMLGDRRDHFGTRSDVWEMFSIVLNERRRREMDPTLNVLREIMDELGDSESEDEFTRERLQELLDFFETIMSLYEQLENLPLSSVKNIAKMGNLAGKLLGIMPVQK
ncbi:MAG TPA: MarR family transcriptional regulator [Anaerolineales bacterium]|nr:MarR family transcriptional regulator [Anaerolineales bacterium]